MEDHDQDPTPLYGMDPGAMIPTDGLIDVEATRVALCAMPITEVPGGMLAEPAMMLQFRGRVFREETEHETETLIMSSETFLTFAAKVMECIMAVDTNLALQCMNEAAKQHLDQKLNDASPGRANPDLN